MIALLSFADLLPVQDLKVFSASSVGMKVIFFPSEFLGFGPGLFRCSLINNIAELFYQRYDKFLIKQYEIKLFLKLFSNSRYSHKKQTKDIQT